MHAFSVFRAPAAESLQQRVNETCGRLVACCSRHRSFSLACASRLSRVPLESLGVTCGSAIWPPFIRFAGSEARAQLRESGASTIFFPVQLIP